VILTCAEAETALRGLLDRFPSAADVEVRGAGLEDAFLALTADEPPEPTNVEQPQPRN
jgi:ABC-2 type transport system ATP-binding protein